MKKKEQELLNYLSEFNKPIRSAEIANALDISVRSVKNYVHNINSLYGKNIILSSRNGYELNLQNNYSLVLTNSSEQIPQTLEERSFFIIKQLVLNHSTQIEIFDLCDSLCVSYSTIKSIISKMNKTYSSYNLEFYCEHDCVRIKGDEINKRKLLSYIINEESKSSIMNVNVLKNNFASIDVEKLQNIIFTTFKKYNYYLNDFSSMNLLLHLLIIVDRELNGNELNDGQNEVSIDNQDELNFLNEFIAQLETTFEISINKYERFEIYMLFKTNANFSIEDSSKKLKELVGDNIIELIDKYVEDINNIYMVDLSSKAFKTPFTLHLKNLLLRAQSGKYTSNPMAETIKNNSPLIFDIAIYISLDLAERFNIKINEDETAFLAMHIGSEIERQADNKDKIPVAILCPNYHNMADQIMNSLMLNFGNQLNMVGSIHNENDFYTLNNPVSILFTTIPVTTKIINTNTNEPLDVVLIFPLNLKSQFSIIQNAILQAQEKYRDRKLKVKFNDFFEQSLFVVDSKLKNKKQVLTKLCDCLLVQNYVDTNFEESVYKRENAAGTAFGNVAIPHSIEMNAIKTSIAVAISKEGIQWNSNIVHIVLLLAINKADRRSFRALYESLISLFSEDKVIQEIRNCTSFDEFKSIIYTALGEKENEYEA
ncbi:BglG family transcription antiterminator [Holdemanella biformis]